MVGVVTKFVVLSFFLTIVRCDGPDRGNWTVENCIMVSMAAQVFQTELITYFFLNVLSQK